jgi:hypothetical protein
MSEIELREFFERMQVIGNSGVNRPFDIYNGACFINGEKVYDVVIDSGFCQGNETLAMSSLHNYEDFIKMIEFGGIEITPCEKLSSKRF